MSEFVQKRFYIRLEQEIILAIHKVEKREDPSQVVRDALDMYFAANGMKSPAK